MTKDPFERLRTLEKQWGLKIHPENTITITRPTDKSLYTFLDKFTEDYSWRENIETNQINIEIFKPEGLNYFNFNDLVGVQNYKILKWLSKSNLINLIDNEDVSYLVEVLDLDGLYKIMNNLHPDIEPAIIKYNTKTGQTQFNNKTVKIRSKNKKIFDLLAKNPNERISKSKIWRILGYRDSMKKQSTIDLNGYITNLRQALGASSKEISLTTKKDFLTLHADLEFTD